MRDRFSSSSLLASVLAAALAVSCTQEPYTLAPDTTDATWRTLYETGPQRSMLRTVWVEAADDIWAGGEHSTFVHYDGREWADVALSPGLPPETVVYEIEGDGAGTLYAATSAGVYRHTSGGWNRIGEGARAMSVIGPDNVVAVQTPALVHFDGHGWSTLADSVVPIPPDAIWASSRFDVYMVAYESVFHFDGTTSEEVLEVSRALVDVWGTGPTDVFVGGYPSRLMHFDGTKWATASEPYWGNHSLHIAWGHDGSNLWLARSDGDLIDTSGEYWIRHAAPIPAFIQGCHGREGVGTAVCGAYGLVMFYDGSEWSILRGRSPVRITAAWPLADGSVVVAYTWTAGVSRMACFDGEDWQELPTLDLPTVVGLWGADVAHLAAVTEWGYAFRLNGEYWDDIDWFRPHPFSLTDAEVDSENDVLTCGMTGVWRLAADKWNDLGMLLEGDDYFTAVAGDGAGSVVAVSYRGEACVLRDSVWTRTVVEPGLDFDDVWMGSADFAVAIGKDAGTGRYRVYQFDGRKWTVPPLGPDWSARQVVGRASDDVFIVGVESLYHFDGRYWGESSSGPSLADVVFGNGRVIGWSPSQLVEIDGR